MKMFVAGEWVDRAERIEVRNPFNAAVIDTVPKASPEDVDRGIAAAEQGAKIMAKVPLYDRSRILAKAAKIMAERVDELGKIISSEEGKTLAEGRFEASRATETMQLSAEEAKRITGDMIPLDAAPGGEGKLCFTLRVPCGVVAAITPFNFPLNLVCHKVGPALAAGNSVIIKPASDTPLSAIKLVEILLEAGIPPLAVSCVTGSGGTVGAALARDPRIRKLSFTGSKEVGLELCRVAGLKKITMELGSNSPLIVLPDADLDYVAEAAIATGYGNAGQVCISTQRILALTGVYADLLDALRPKVAGLTVGDQLAPDTKMGPMIREADAKRVESWVQEAVTGGARLEVGGGRKGAVMEPTLLANVDRSMRIGCDELFGPAVCVMPVENIDEAIALANQTEYGLSAGVFTQNLNWALRFAREIESGNIHINWGPAWRADLMPYGGLKQSGIGREGPHYAIEEMTETKTIVIHPGRTQK